MKLGLTRPSQRVSLYFVVVVVLFVQVQPVIVADGKPVDFFPLEELTGCLRVPCAFQHFSRLEACPPLSPNFIQTLWLVINDNISNLCPYITLFRK